MTKKPTPQPPIPPTPFSVPPLDEDEEDIGPPRLPKEPTPNVVDVEDEGPIIINKENKKL